MLLLLALVIPTVIYALTPFQAVGLALLLAVVVLYTVIRYYAIAIIMSGAVSPAASDYDQLLLQTCMNIATIVATFALVQAGYTVIAIMFGITIPFAFYYQMKATFFNESTEEDTE